MRGKQLAGSPLFEALSPEATRWWRACGTPGRFQQATLLIFERGQDVAADPEHVRERIASRLARIPGLRRCVALTPLRRLPIWIDAAEVALDYHIRHTSVPKPGSREQLDALIGRVLARPLDQTRPLWEAWCIEGVEGGRRALLLKSHPAAEGGLARAALIEALFENRDPETPGGPWIPRPYPGFGELLAWEVGLLAGQGMEVLRAGQLRRLWPPRIWRGDSAGAGRLPASHLRAVTLVVPAPVARGTAGRRRCLADLAIALVSALRKLGDVGRPARGERAVGVGLLDGPTGSWWRVEIPSGRWDPRATGREVRAAMRAGGCRSFDEAFGGVDLRVSLADVKVGNLPLATPPAVYSAPVGGQSLSACVSFGEACTSVTLVAEWERFSALTRLGDVLSSELGRWWRARTQTSRVRLHRAEA